MLTSPGRGQAPPLPYTGLKPLPMLAARYRYLFDNRDAFGGQEVERFQVVDVAQAEDGLVDAHSGQFCKLLNGLGPGCCPVARLARQVETVERGFLDLLVRAAHRLAVIAQGVQLMLHLVLAQTGEEGAGISVLGNQAQRLALAAPTDKNRRMRLLDDLR